MSGDTTAPRPALRPIRERRPAHERPGFMPEQVKVGPTEWAITVDPDAKLYGKTKHKDATIVLCPQAETSMRDSLLHEVLHAVFWIAGGTRLLELDKEAEERLVRLLSPYLLSLIRDNQALIYYLTLEP